MQRKFISVVLSVAVAAISLASLSAHAATIGGLVNTGVGASGSIDSNYKLTAVTSDTTLGTTTPTITLDNQWPINPWMANSTTSKWITPTASQGQSFDGSVAGSYTYTLQFDLSGYNAASAAFTGRFAADNAAVVKLNNVEIASGSGFSDWTALSASSGFQPGVNTLDFVVANWAQNGGNPTGLRVEFATSSIAAAVPEPETYAMLLAGGALMGFIARRQARKQAS